MAGFLTHTVFAKEVLKRINNEKLKKQIQLRMNLFILGAQGPDIFYYYFNFIFGRHKREYLQKIGSIMHTLKTGDFLKLGIEYALESADEKHKLDLITYMLGFMCHFHLDSSIHPYVCFCSKNGIYKEDGNLTKVSHQDIETSIDIIYFREKEGKSAQKTKLHKSFNTGSVPSVVFVFLNYALKNLFNLDISPKTIKKCMVHMRRAFVLLYDPFGLKNTILISLGVNIPKPFYTAREKTNIDWLNRKRKRWHHLEDRNEIYTQSVDELYKTALKNCSDLITAMYQKINKKQKLDGLFPNISYITNKPCKN
ncbi:MAG: zinc dependent phospholipase C family protein [Clostridium sp.]|jgi:hypothetical protein|nr:zinc dependent phospholipase C family protein [Clostridium sp.]